MSTDSNFPVLLLVEDEYLLVPILEDALSAEGFNVVTAHDGTTALQELEARATEFKAVITDIRLGTGPSGWDVGRRARELVPSMPVIYMSGDSAHDWSANGVPESVMLQKPFVGAQLITAVATLLNSTSATESVANDPTKPSS
ncbi:DNA-binding response OmpR family regulator [Phyllobacterium trifolii]|uniref:DNA-binding response OmpR family regulator n=1 Tax=Phyllobacterium trifolii TaxID=300193 RepID=A0A839U8B6_9HYPH|nr:response regulator [Phyllobacterium trifolii]MBB3144961.1 DNA-binding response OmpR family regulator [Phyllobacterium trifolii]